MMSDCSLGMSDCKMARSGCSLVTLGYSLVMLVNRREMLGCSLDLSASKKDS